MWCSETLPIGVLRAACLQNETAPKSFNFKTRNGPKNDPKLHRNILSLVLLCRISHRHYSKIFHREFPHKIKHFFSRRESAGMATPYHFKRKCTQTGSAHLRSRPGKPNQRKGQNEKFMNFAHFCEFWCFSLGKQARFTLNFCSGTPLRKVHELTFFGLVCRGHS